MGCLMMMQLTMMSTSSIYFGNGAAGARLGAVPLDDLLDACSLAELDGASPAAALRAEDENARLHARRGEALDGGLEVGARRADGDPRERYVHASHLLVR